MRRFLVARPGLPLGIVIAIVAVAAIVGWSWEVHIVLQLAIAWLSLALAAVAMLTLPVRETRLRAIVVMLLGVAGFVFWLGAPELFGALPGYAYLVTAAVMVGAGVLAPPQRKGDTRSVLIALAIAAFFIITGSYTRIVG